MSDHPWLRALRIVKSLLPALSQQHIYCANGNLPSSSSLQPWSTGWVSWPTLVSASVSHQWTLRQDKNEEALQFQKVPHQFSLFTPVFPLTLQCNCQNERVESYFVGSHFGKIALLCVRKLNRQTELAENWLGVQLLLVPGLENTSPSSFCLCLTAFLQKTRTLVRANVNL